MLKNVQNFQPLLIRNDTAANVATDTRRNFELLAKTILDLNAAVEALQQKLAAK